MPVVAACPGLAGLRRPRTRGRASRRSPSTPGLTARRGCGLGTSATLCASPKGRLLEIKTLRRGLVRWIFDSRSFSELSQRGRWTISAEQYAADVARYDEEICGLQWAAPQDWMFTCFPRHVSDIRHEVDLVVDHGADSRD